VASQFYLPECWRPTVDMIIKPVYLRPVPRFHNFTLPIKDTNNYILESSTDFRRLVLNILNHFITTMFMYPDAVLHPVSPIIEDNTGIIQVKRAFLQTSVTTMVGAVIWWIMMHSCIPWSKCNLTFTCSLDVTAQKTISVKPWVGNIRKQIPPITRLSLIRVTQRCFLPTV